MAKQTEASIREGLVKTAFPPDIRKQATTIETELPALAPDLTILTEDQYRYWADQRIAANDQIKELTERRLRITRPMDAAKKEVMDLFEPPISFRKSFLGVIDPKLLAFEEREKAEKNRINREALEAARIVQEGMIRKAEKKAAKLEAKGDLEGAASVLNQLPVAASPSLKPATAPKVSGMSTMTLWRAEITDPHLLLKKHPEYFLTEQVLGVITSMLDKVATASKGTTIIEGVRFYPEQHKRS